MSKFHVIRIQKKADGTEVRTIFPFEDSKEAEIKFYNVLSADLSDENIVSGIAIIINDETGFPYTVDGNLFVRVFNR